MHAKTDSEVTSLAPSSPARSPPRGGGAAAAAAGAGAGTIPPPPAPAPARAVYYVQSPSRDSHDGEKTATSLHSTPAASPPHYAHSSVGRHSRESSSTSRFSGSLKPHGPASAAAAAAAGSRRVSPNDASAGAAARGGAAAAERWKDGGVIEEEGLLDEEGERRGIPRRCCYVLGFVMAFLVLFFFFALILWGASHNQKPIVTMTSITFENFIIQAGTDASLVPTELSTLNTTVKLTFRNTGRFFGVHVSSTTLDIYYSQIKMASGNMNEFYQSRKSQRSVSVVVLGNQVPLYGGGAGLSSSPPAAAAGKAAAANPPTPLTLSFRTRARAYVLGELVKPKFDNDVQCSVLLDQSKLNTPVSLKNTCQYNS